MDCAIETARLSRHFAEVRAVSDLSLHVPRGSVYAFLGPNGAGKTTTIRMLLGLTRPDHGDIRVFDTLLTRATRRTCLRRIGALAETPAVYPHLTGYENLQVTQRLLALSSSNVPRVIQIVGLEGVARRLVRTYSLGMRQRLGIAAALLASPALLILDEPTNGLDPAGIHEMRELIRSFPAQHGITIFLSSHLLAEVEQVANYVGIIGHGRLLFEGTLADVQQRERERVRIEVDRPQVAVSILREHGWHIEGADASQITATCSTRTDLARAATALVGAGLALYQLRTERSSLEELFLDLTSKANLVVRDAAEVRR